MAHIDLNIDDKLKCDTTGPVYTVMHVTKTTATIQDIKGNSLKIKKDRFGRLIDTELGVWVYKKIDPVD